MPGRLKAKIICDREKKTEAARKIINTKKELFVSSIDF
jgi:hypothetical protein